MSRSNFSRLACAVLATVVGCSDGDGGGGGEETGLEIPSIGQSKSKLVKADEGGMVRLGDAELRIPAGALRDDTELSIEAVELEGAPDAARLRGPAYDMGPDGTQFAEPVEIELPLERLPKSNERAELVWLDTELEEWVGLPGAAVKDGRVFGRADHFSTFTIRFTIIEGEVSVQSGDSPSCDGAFSACGGDVEGTWSFVDLCLDLGDIGVDPGDECGATGFESEVSVTGSVTLAGGVMTGTQETSVTTTVNLPLSCLGGATCEDLGYTESDGACVTTMSIPPETTEIDETYTIEGNTFITDSDGTVTEFCVQGNTMTMRFLDDETGTESLSVLERQ